MRNSKSCYLILVNIFCIFNLIAQENSLYKNSFLNPFIINPAATGMEYYTVAELSVKKQWVDFPDAPTTYLLAINYRIGKYDFYNPNGLVNKNMYIDDRVGLGAVIYKDNNGPLSNTGFILSPAYHIPVNADSRLSFGISIIGNYYSIRSSILKPDNPNDNYLLYENKNHFRLNSELGILFYNKNYYLGLSADKIFPDITIANGRVRTQPSIFGIGGCKLLNRTRMSIEPSFIIRKNIDQKVAVDIYSKFYIQRLNWIALSYSTAGKMNILFGIHLIKMIYAGYNYEYSLGDISSYNSGSHEVFLGINLGLFNIEGIRQRVH